MRSSRFGGIRRIFLSSFSDSGAVGSYQPAGKWKSACLWCHAVVILPGISGGHASDRTVGARHMDEKKK